MTTAARVKLWGTNIGTVVMRDDHPAASFEYDRDFLQSRIEVSPIEMPLSQKVYSFPGLPEITFRGLPGLLADSLPDKYGNQLIKAWLTRQGRGGDSLNAVEQLCYTGKRGMGALEYEPAIFDGADSSEELNVGELVKLASDILKNRNDMIFKENSHVMEQIIKVGTSAGGARAKAIVAWNRDTGEIRSGQIDAGDGFEYWLIKFDGIEGNRDKEEEDRPHYTQIEYAYYLMAKAAGIDMSECMLYEECGRQHFMTRRFDRTVDTGEKIHMQTLGSMAHFDYNSPGAYGYEQAADIMRRLEMGQAEIEQLFRRMVFNVASRNQDDHVKNISFLMDKKGVWSLSPAYDVTYAFNPGGMWTGSHQMTVNGKRKDIGREDLLDCAGHMNISKYRAGIIIAEVSEAVHEWPGFAMNAGLGEKIVESISAAHVLV